MNASTAQELTLLTARPAYAHRTVLEQLLPASARPDGWAEADPVVSMKSETGPVQVPPEHGRKLGWRPYCRQLRGLKGWTVLLVPAVGDDMTAMPRCAGRRARRENPECDCPTDLSKNAGNSHTGGPIPKRDSTTKRSSSRRFAAM